MTRISPSIRTRALAVAVLTVAAASPAAAATCADRTVQARGEPSRFEVVAKASARGNWRASVRANPALGPPYANWNIAQAADYTCAESERQLHLHGHRATLPRLRPRPRPAAWLKIGCENR